MKLRQLYYIKLLGQIQDRVLNTDLTELTDIPGGKWNSGKTNWLAR